MSGHTPGPWRLDSNDLGWPFVVVSAIPYRMIGDLEGRTADEAFANAALIAAAPDLLEALEDAAVVLENAAHLLLLKGLVDTASSASQTAKDARAAIAKAKVRP